MTPDQILANGRRIVGTLFVTVVTCVGAACVAAAGDQQPAQIEAVSAVPGMSYSTVTYQGHLFHLVTVDLTANVCFLSAFGNDTYVGGRERVTSMATGYGAGLGINTDYFGGSQPPDAMAYRLGTRLKCDRFRTSLGISASNTTSIQTGYNGAPRFVGDEVCGGTRTDPAYLFNVVGGGPQVVRNGARYWTKTGCCTVNGEGYGQYMVEVCEGIRPVERMSAIGVSQDGHAMYVVVSSAGVDIWTTMDFLISRGAYTAIKFDGGSSSELYFDGQTRGPAGASVAEALLAIAAPTTPTLSTPADGATGVGASVALDWSDATRAVTYELQAGTACGTGSITTSSASNVSVGSLAEGTTYYWRVRAKNICGATGSWSACRSFQTACGTPAVPSPSDPPDGATNEPTSLTLTSTSAPSAVAYEAQVGTSCGSGTVSSSATPGILVSGLSTSTSYAWRVRAQDACGTWSAWSGCRSFTTSASGTCAPCARNCAGECLGCATPADLLHCQQSAASLASNELNAAEWVRVGQPAALLVKPGQSYRLGFEYRARTGVRVSFGLSRFGMVGRPLDHLAVSVDLVPGSEHWHPYWSAPFAVTTEQLGTYPNLRLVLGGALDADLEIRNLRLYSAPPSTQEERGAR